MYIIRVDEYEVWLHSNTCHERLQPQFNVQSVVWNLIFLLWFLEEGC